MDRKMNIQVWLDAATGGIRFKPDRAAVEQELREHIEDKWADLQRLYPDMAPEEAEERALSQMGDAAEIGRELARLHRPWLGYLWRLSQALTLVLAVLALWNVGNIGGIWTQGSVSNYRELRESYQARFPDSLEEAGADQGEVLAIGAGEKEVRAGGYTFSVYRASVIRRTEGTDFLYFTLRGTGRLPWELPAEDLGQWIQVTDSQGRLYRSWRNADQEGKAQTTCGWTERGLLWREYEGDVFLYFLGEGTALELPLEEQFQIEFDNGAICFTIPIRWEEVAG